MVFLQGFPKKIAFLQKVLKHVFSGLGRPWVFMCGIILFSSSSTPTPGSNSSFIFHLVKKFRWNRKMKLNFGPFRAFFGKIPKIASKSPIGGPKSIFAKKSWFRYFIFASVRQFSEKKRIWKHWNRKFIRLKLYFSLARRAKFFQNSTYHFSSENDNWNLLNISSWFFNH